MTWANSLSGGCEQGPTATVGCVCVGRHKVAQDSSGIVGVASEQVRCQLYSVLAAISHLSSDPPVPHVTSSKMRFEFQLHLRPKLQSRTGGRNRGEHSLQTVKCQHFGEIRVVATVTQIQDAIAHS